MTFAHRGLIQGVRVGVGLVAVAGLLMVAPTPLSAHPTREPLGADPPLRPAVDHDAGREPRQQEVSWAPPMPGDGARSTAPERDRASEGWDASWLPLLEGRLYRTMLADPTQVNFSIGLRLWDRVIETNVIDASFGAVFPLLRVERGPDQIFQASVEAGVWFIPWTLPTEDGQRAQEFFSSDFHVGFPLAYRQDQWSFRLRPYHVSFHLGDEATLEHLDGVPRSKTINAAELFAAYDFSFGLRSYAGVGEIVWSSGNLPGGPLYLSAGSEYEFGKHSWDFFQTRNAFYVAAFVRSWPLSGESINGSYAIGYIGRPRSAVSRAMRGYIEVNHGRSWVGRFSDKEVHTLGVRLAFDN